MRPGDDSEVTSRRHAALGVSTPLSASAPNGFASPVVVAGAGGAPFGAGANGTSLVPGDKDGAINGDSKPVVTAAPEQPNAVMRYGSLSLLVVQNCSAVLLTRYVQSPGRERFSIFAANLCVEVVKLLICAGAILAGFDEPSAAAAKEHGGARALFGLLPAQGVTDLKEAVLSKTSWQMAVPAGLFTLQNSLLFVALANLDATLFQVSYQLKLLCTAVLMVVMLGRELKPIKWAALVLLFLGIVLTQLKPQKPKPSSSQHEESVVLGMAAVLTCSLCSAFAGVYFEKVLKTAGASSLLVRNVQLAIFAFLLNLLVMGYNGATSSSSNGAAAAASKAVTTTTAGGDSTPIFAFLTGFDGFVWALVLVQAAGGLLVATVIKYADNIAKGFATAVAIIVNGIISYVWLDWTPTNMFLLGAAIVIAATMMYSV